MQVAALVLGLLWVGQGARVHGPAARRALDLPLLLFLGWSAVSLLWAPDPGAGLVTLGHWAACAVVYAVVSRAARLADVPRLAGALLLGGAAVAVVGLGQALLGLDLVPQAAVPAATLANRNVAAGYLAAIAPLALLAWSSRLVRAAAAVAADRDAGLPPLHAVAHRRRGGGPAARPAGARLGAARPAGAASEPESLSGPAGREPRPGARRRVGHAGRPREGRSASIRWSLAGSALSMALDRPLLGVGLGGFGARYPSHGPVVRSALGTPLRVESPHNESLQVLAETGLPGLLAGLWVAAAAAFARPTAPALSRPGGPPRRARPRPEPRRIRGRCRSRIPPSVSRAALRPGRPPRPARGPRRERAARSGGSPGARPARARRPTTPSRGGDRLRRPRSRSRGRRRAPASRTTAPATWRLSCPLRTRRRPVAPA